jgi:hypothetical protein
MSYRVGLMLESGSTLEINDRAGFEFVKNLLLMDIFSALSLRSLSENDPVSSDGNNKQYGGGCQNLHFQVSGTARMG